MDNRKAHLVIDKKRKRLNINSNYFLTLHIGKLNLLDLNILRGRAIISYKYL